MAYILSFFIGGILRFKISSAYPYVMFSSRDDSNKVLIKTTLYGVKF